MKPTWRREVTKNKVFHGIILGHKDVEIEERDGNVAVMMENKSNFNLSSSNNDDDDRHRRLKQAVEVELASDDEEWSPKSSGVAASLRDFAESMMRRQGAELEMMKTREVVRIEAENRRLERETELTEMMLKTQLQLSSFICSQTCDRKRKRGEEDGSESPVSVERKGAMLLSLLHFNFGI
ncbi:hypothetical protein L1987_05291 [Smallanthus sonchifolius]|uniref:Uncharacterized protein n=1 Tax=Smallanthus sonchifolius TaxID=185202 RepID=A0ACB9JUY2_9ASTR|nr:hypothetical protein L1987_05291 [Smallanthus sonchifolius]